MNIWIRRLSLLALISLLRPACGGSGGGPGKILLASTPVSAAAGGTVAVTDPALTGTQVVIPAGALAADTTITIHQVPDKDPDVLSFEFGPEGTTFSAPVTITVKYLDSYLANKGVLESQLRVVGSDLHVAAETFATSAQDTAANTISAQTVHFSQYSAVGYTNATISGDYELISYMYETGTPQLNANTTGNPQPVPKGFKVSYGNLHADGAGSFSYSGTKRIDTSPSGDTGSAGYAVAADGTFTMSGGATINGSVLASGTVLIFGTASNQPQISVGVKKGGASFNTASLSGDYGIITYMYETGTTQPNTTTVGTPANPPLGFTCTKGILTFDGAGSVSLTGTRNTDGASSPDTGSASYSVSSGGILTLVGGGGGTGALLAGGSVLIWTTTANQPQLSLCVKRGGTFSTASLNGAYGTVFYRFEGGTVQPATQTAGNPTTHPNGFQCSVGTLTFDGAGNASYSGTKNTDGTASADTGTDTYSVASDGTFSMTNISGYVLEGGSVVIWMTNAPAGPQISISIRK